MRGASSRGVSAPCVRGWAAGLLFAAGFLVPAVCAAEIYGWVDQFGNFTYSNMPPPKDARVTDVIPEEAAPSAAARADAAHQREVDALNERVQMLELERTRQMQAAEYPSYPAYPAPVPVAAGCGPDDYCDWGPAYFTGGVYRYRPYRGVAGPRFGPPFRGGAPAMRVPAGGIGRGAARGR